MELDITDVARRHETKQANSAAELSQRHRRLGDVVAAYGGPGSYLNRASGFLPGAQRPDDDVLDAVMAFFREQDATPRLELCSLLPDAWFTALTRRGLALQRVDNLFVRKLPANFAVELPPGIKLERVNPGDPQRALAFAQASEAGATPGDTPPRASIEATLRAVRLPLTDMYCARAGDEIVGTSGSESSLGFTALFGASVAPGYRRHGLHRAMIATRLRRAVERGSDFATVSCTPGGPTDRNARRLGFSLAYVRLIFGPREGQ